MPLQKIESTCTPKQSAFRMNFFFAISVPSDTNNQ